MIGPDDPFRGVNRISRDSFASLLRQMAAPEVAAERDPGDYWDVAMAYAVDPLLLLAIFQHESGMGRLGVARQTHSWGNTRMPSFGVQPVMEDGTYQTVAGRTGRFPVYHNWLDGAVSTVARLASLDYPHDAPYGRRGSIRAIFDHPSGLVWAPAGDLNDPHGYLATVLEFMSRHASEEPSPMNVLTIIPTWGSPNQTPGRAGKSPRAIVIHVAEGTEDGTVSWFMNADSQVSSHFFVCLDGRIRQFVKLEDTAWANGVLVAPFRASSSIIADWAATPKDPSWPAGLPNLESISIELEGYYQNDPPPAQWTSLVALVAAISQATGIPAVRDRIIGHHQLDTRTRRNCPGLTVTQWDALIREVQAHLAAVNPEDAALDAYWQAHRDGLGEKRNPGAGKLNRDWGGSKVLLLERGVLAYQDGLVIDITQRALDDLISLYWTKDGSLVLYGAPPTDA